MRKIAAIILLVIMTAGICSCESTDNTGANSFTGFRIVFLNTGKSDCIIIQMDDITVMCDTSDKLHINYVASALKTYGITKLDYIILTHFDKDHIGGAASVLRSMDTGTVYAPKSSADSSAYRNLVSALNAGGKELTYVTENVHITTANGSFTIYAPFSESYADDNAYSLITAVNYKDKSLLLTGDATKTRLSEFLSIEAAQTTYDVIKLPHHGEYTKSLLVLIENSAPKYGIVTCESSKETVEKKLEKTADKYGMELLYTFEGDIVFEYADGELKKV